LEELLLRGQLAQTASCTSRLRSTSAIKTCALFSELGKLTILTNTFIGLHLSSLNPKRNPGIKRDPYNLWLTPSYQLSLNFLKILSQREAK
jgi:hypothetical protein